MLNEEGKNNKSHQIPKTKGTLLEAENGVSKLILEAFNVRKQSISLKCVDLVVELSITPALAEHVRREMIDILNFNINTNLNVVTPKVKSKLVPKDIISESYLDIVRNQKRKVGSSLDDSFIEGKKNKILPMDNDAILKDMSAKHSNPIVIKGDILREPGRVLVTPSRNTQGHFGSFRQMVGEQSHIQKGSLQMLEKREQNVSIGNIERISQRILDDCASPGTMINAVQTFDDDLVERKVDDEKSEICEQETLEVSSKKDFLLEHEIN